MSRKNNAEVRFTINADEIAEGDIIKDLKSGDTWQVVSEPQYTSRGIKLEVMTLFDDETSCFIYAKLQQQYELVNYKPASLPAVAPVEPTSRPYFVHSHIHQGQLIGILSNGAGYGYSIFSHGFFEESPTHYRDLGAALNTAIARVEQECRWQAGFRASEQQKPFPEIADVDFARGWQDGLEAYGGVASLKSA